MANLREETINILKSNGKSIQDIEWIGTRNFKVPFDSELNILNIDYYSGYGSAEIMEDLIIVGKDFWLERREYDGSEWWAFMEFPKVPNSVVVIDNFLEKLS